MSTTRVPAGVPTGGQFAAAAHPETGVSLVRPFAGTTEQVAGPPDDLATAEGGSTFFAVEDGQRIGYVHVSDPEWGEVEIHHMWTDPDHRHRGVARALMTQVAESLPTGTAFRTAEFSDAGRGFADALRDRVGIEIVDDSEDDEW